RDSPFAGRLLMILGAPRSGTTWLAAMVHAHPLVSGADEAETWIFVGLQDVWANHRRPGPHGLAYWMDERALALAIRRFCDAVFGARRDREQADGGWFVEKSPEHGRLLPQIRLVYPDAVFVHILRDGRDVASSMAEAD